MTLNYLLLAHNNFDHLDYLIEALDGADVRFVIHIDKKTKTNYSSTKSNVFVLKNRLSVNWGKFGVVRATLQLLEFAAQQGGGRYILLSGSDYPVRSNAFIREMMERDTEYINILPAPLPHKPLSRFQYYHLNFDGRNKSSYNKVLTKIQNLLIRKNVRRKIPFKLYAGSQWFALTHACVEYILHEVKQNPQYINFFKYTAVPDEAFFHTIIGNSKFYKNISNSLTFMQWGSDTSPALLSEKEIDFLAEHKEARYKTYGKYIPLFGRKFNKQNIHLLPVIESRLR